LEHESEHETALFPASGRPRRKYPDAPRYARDFVYHVQERRAVQLSLVTIKTNPVRVVPIPNIVAKVPMNINMAARGDAL
jgi:hypothetical protein